MVDQIKDIFIKHGADICGIAHVDLFADAPKGFHPCDIYKDCRSIIVFAKALPKGIALVSPRMIYQHFNGIGPIELDRIAIRAAVEIERQFGAIVVPIPSDSPYEYWDVENMEGKGTISMKHAAVLAGIGTMGKSSMLLNERYGSMLTIGAVLTNLELPSDNPAEDVCIKSCRVCIESCPTGAIGDGGIVNQKLCRLHTYDKTERGFGVVKCNACRTKCPMAFGKK